MPPKGKRKGSPSVLFGRLTRSKKARELTRRSLDRSTRSLDRLEKTPEYIMSSSDRSLTGDYPMGSRETANTLDNTVVQNKRIRSANLHTQIPDGDDNYSSIKSVEGSSNVTLTPQSTATAVPVASCSNKLSQSHTQIDKNTSDISDLYVVEAEGAGHVQGHQRQSEASSEGYSVRLSEDDFNTPELISDRLKVIYTDLDTLRSLETVQDGHNFALPTHACVTKKVEDLNRHTVMNGMTEQFGPTLMKIMVDADNIRDRLLQRKEDLTVGHPGHTVRFASRYARSLSDSSAMDPVFNDPLTISHDPSNVGFTGWSQQVDREVVEDRLRERLLEAETRLSEQDRESEDQAAWEDNELLDRIIGLEVTLEKQRFEPRLKKLNKRLQDVEMSATTGNNQIVRTAAALIPIQNQLSAIAKQQSKRTNQETEQLFERVSAIERDLENHKRLTNLANEATIKRAVKEAVDKEVKAHSERQAEMLKREIEAAVKQAKDSVVRELTPLYQQLPPAPTQPIHGDSTPSGANVSVLQKQFETLQIGLNKRLAEAEKKSVENQSKTDGLISSDKKRRSQLKAIQDAVDAGVLRASTPLHTQNVSDNSTTRVAGNNTTRLSSEFSKRKLEKMIERIMHHANVQVAESADIAEVRKRHAVDLPKLAKDLDAFAKLISEYLKYDDIEDEFYQKCLTTSDKAEAWIRNVEYLYDRMDVHTVDNEKNKPSSQAITKFNGDHTQTVYEFLEEFEAAYITVGVSKTRAGIMHKSCLSDWIKSQTTHLAMDYNGLKSWLIETHGDIITVTSKLITALEGAKRPSSSTSYKERLEFFLAISNTMMRVERLSTLSQLSTEKVNEHLHSRVVLDRLVTLLPDADDIKLMEVMRVNGMDTRKFQGKYTYTVYKDYIHAQVDDMQRAVERAGRTTAPAAVQPKPKQKVVNTAAIDNCDSGSDDEAGYPKVTLSANASGPWWKDGLKFPCPMLRHDHEIGTCKEFFALTPQQRRQLSKSKKGSRERLICWACLQPITICAMSCKRNPAIVDVLKCQGCLEYAKSKGIPPLNPLFCSNPDHNEVKPPPALFIKELKKYLKGNMSPAISEKTLVYSNFGCMSFNSLVSANSPTKSSLPNPNASMVAFDTHTGERASDEDITPRPEPQDDAFFLMQTITIGSSECLVLFDRGSNVNLIDGYLAEREGLQVLSERPSAIKVVGGEEVPTQFGTYKLVIGSKESGQFHTLVCHGMSQVTTNFSKYPLHEINHEVMTKTNAVDQCEPLPAAVGGSPAHLLIGIKDVALDPTLITTLESGVGVYMSPFTDKYGSNICYGGAHPVFSKGNKQSGCQAILSSLSMYMRNAEEELETRHNIVEDLEEQLQYAIKGEKGTELYPTPLTIQDFYDLGCRAEESQMEQYAACSGDEIQAHLCSVNKAVIPISRMRELIDQDDIGDTVSYRCPTCSKCITCKKTSKENAVSIQGKVEQEALEKSVHVDLVSKTCWVDVPFLQDPDEFLIKKHRGNSNRYQAIKVYRSQCNKPDAMKESMREVHRDLVKQGFITRLSDLSKEIQRMIKESPFMHFYPWRMVIKPDSVSTEVRMVVDPTMTGLNLILPKGENNLGRMNDILIRARVGEFLWMTDIRKMYNQLKVKPDSLRFQLMLFSDEMTPDIDPDVWVMESVWYGVTSSGNQAGIAVTTLGNLGKEEHPAAEEPLSPNSRFVDDVGSTSATAEEREEQIHAVRSVLGMGGFSLKFIVRSGVAPDEKASADGKTVKLLGYKYNPEEDMLSPSFSELNMNKKIRGAKRANPFPVTTTQEAAELLTSVKITRRKVMSKLAEFFDPIGMFEPVKLQLKLGLSALNEFKFDEPLPTELQIKWKDRLAQLMELPSLSVKRNVIPSNNGHSQIRLLCFSDAGEHAGGAAVYAGVQLADGSYSCGLVASKSKIMSGTVPRNELSAIMLMTELAFIVKRALGDRVQEMLYFTDSTIALSWCHNTSIKLRLYVHNRVETIRRMIEWTTGSDNLPLYHINSEDNIADMITKPREVEMEEVSLKSEWQAGKAWMHKPTLQMPITAYQGINMPSKKQKEFQEECFSEPFFLTNKDTVHQLVLSNIESPQPEEHPLASQTVASGPKARTPFFIDLIGQGWFKGLRITAQVILATIKLKHKIHVAKEKSAENCILCVTEDGCSTEQHIQKQAEDTVFAHETRFIVGTMEKKKLNQFILKGDILYFSGRVAQENPFRFKDLDAIPFLDAPEIVGITPVVLADSDIFFSYLMAVHTKIAPHAGVIYTAREIAKKMYVPAAAKRIIQKVRSDCTRCRIIFKKTVELEMQKHAFPRTMIAPPFYNAMVDIAYGFPGLAYKNARKRVAIYALVMVCLLTGATSIMALEGIETQDVVHALERHSSKYGAPAEIFIDNGTQLKALEHAEFSIRDADAQVYDAIGMRITVSAAKSHEERGRVERRIGLLRDMLERMVDPTTAQTALQWETLFAKVSSTIDDLPLAKGNTSNEAQLGCEILTANRIKMGRNSSRSLAAPGILLDMPASLTKLLERNRQMYHTWYQLFIDQVHLLALKPNKWQTTSRLPVIDDIVLFVQLDGSYSKAGKSWKLGRIIETNKSRVKILAFNKSKKGSKATSSVLERNVREVSILFSLDELYVNSREYFQKTNNE